MISTHVSPEGILGSSFGVQSDSIHIPSLHYSSLLISW